MTTDLETMRAQRLDLEMQISALRSKWEQIDRAIKDAESRAWIAINGVTLDRVQLSGGEGVPWHGHIHGFAEWMRAHGATKPYAEWNGRVYLTADLLNGRMPDTPGRIEHVEGAQ